MRVLLSRSAKSAYQFHESIVDGVVSALFLDREEKSDNAQITRREFPLIDAPFPLTDPPQTEKLSRLLQDFLRKEFGPTYRETVYLFKPHKYAVALVVESAGENRQIEKFFDVAKEAAKAQLTKNYPGLICIRIEGMQANDLRETVARELVGVEFRASATDFLNDPRFAHVAGLAFTADGGVISSNNERFQQQGATYFFNNPNNELGRDPDFKIFPSH